jgi:hypothetical protein
MPRRYFLTARPGCDLVHAVENPNYEFSRILEVDNDGTVLSELPYLPDTDYMYNPEPDPEYQRPQKVVTLEGEIVIPTYVPEGKLTTGENPFIQLIYRYCKKQIGGSSPEDIVRHMLREKKFLPDTKQNINRINKYVFLMYDGKLKGLLVVQEGKYLPGLPLKIGKVLVDIQPGYDPYEYQMMRFVENKNLVNRDEIHRLISNRLQWARNSSTIEHYIKQLQIKKCIKLVHGNWFQYRDYPPINL